MIDVQRLREALSQYHATETDDPASSVTLARYVAVALPALLDVYEAACAWVDSDDRDFDEEIELCIAVEDSRMK